MPRQCPKRSRLALIEACPLPKRGPSRNRTQCKPVHLFYARDGRLLSLPCSSQQVRSGKQTAEPSCNAGLLGRGIRRRAPVCFGYLDRDRSPPAEVSRNVPITTALPYHQLHGRALASLKAGMTCANHLSLFKPKPEPSSAASALSSARRSSVACRLSVRIAFGFFLL